MVRVAGFLCWWCASGIIAATGAADKGQAAAGFHSFMCNWGEGFVSGI